MPLMLRHNDNGEVVDSMEVSDDLVQAYLDAGWVVSAEEVDRYNSHRSNRFIHPTRQPARPSPRLTRTSQVPVLCRQDPRGTVERPRRERVLPEVCRPELPRNFKAICIHCGHMYQRTAVKNKLVRLQVQPAYTPLTPALDKLYKSLHRCTQCMEYRVLDIPIVPWSFITPGGPDKRLSTTRRTAFNCASCRLMYCSWGMFGCLCNGRRDPAHPNHSTHLTPMLGTSWCRFCCLALNPDAYFNERGGELLMPKPGIVQPIEPEPEYSTPPPAEQLFQAPTQFTTTVTMSAEDIYRQLRQMAPPIPPQLTTLSWSGPPLTQAYDVDEDDDSDDGPDNDYDEGDDIPF